MNRRNPKAQLDWIQRKTGFNQREIAQLCGLSQSAINGVINGNRKHRWTTTMKIEKVYEDLYDNGGLSSAVTDVAVKPKPKKEASDNGLLVLSKAFRGMVIGEQILHSAEGIETVLLVRFSDSETKKKQFPG